MTTHSTLLDAALAYAADGWRVFPCHTPVIAADKTTCSCRLASCTAIGKHPRTRNGFQDATTDEATIRQWWTTFPTANIGGIPASAGLVAFDLDSDQAMTAARELGLFAEPTFEVRTGNGTHRYYRHAALPSGAMIGGIVVRSGHGYVLLPPSLHASGRHYEVMDGSPALPLPPLALSQALKSTSKEGAKERVLLAATSTRIAPGDRHGALLTLAGSLASANVAEAVALQLVQDSNHARCDPPKPPEEVANIVAFAYSKEKEKHADVARHLILAHSTTRPAPRPVEVIAPNPLDRPLPGILEDIVQWSMATAPQPVRLYAVAAALAAGSVICARRYATSQQNFSSLYVLVVGKSGTGKEHVRRSANALLRASGAAALVGPNEWTSKSAVWSSVYTQPQCLATVDEFGQFLGAASGGSDGAAMKNGVLVALMELFGRVDDFAITPNFSTLTLSDKQRKQAERKVIERPALSLLGLTTPTEWYDSLKSNRVSSGFLNRFLVIEADVPRSDLAIPEPAEPPAVVVQWAEAVLKERSLNDSLTQVLNIPAPNRLELSPEAHASFVAFRRECNRRADRLEAEKLGELPVRAAEQALRLALIAALAEDPAAARVEGHHVDWGVAVASYVLGKLIPSVQERMSDSPIHALRNRFLSALKEAGDRGLTAREMARSAVFRGSAKRDRDETIQWVQEAGHAGWADVPTTGAGRSRFALVNSAIVSHDEAA